MSIPIACNLAALTPAQRQQHTATAESLFNAVDAVHELPDGYALRLPPTMLIMAVEYISHERLCCPFFHFGLEVEPNGGAMWLRLTGAEGVKAFLAAELGWLTSPPTPRQNVAQGAGRGEPSSPLIPYPRHAELEWCRVEVPSEAVSFRNERDEVYGTFRLHPFAISRMPITYQQFQAFVEAPDGWSNPDWWQGLTERYHHQPRLDQRSPVANHPADNVSWYQAVAYSRWLNDQLHGQTLGMGLVVGHNATIRLPLEWEWQWAAQGAEERRYPWGAAWEDGRANTRLARKGATTPVDAYLAGAAACGALDMAGNVWEWCLNSYADPTYSAVDGHLTRVLRGGSFVDIPDYAVCGSRFNDLPNRRLDYWGLRVVCVADTA